MAMQDRIIKGGRAVEGDEFIVPAAGITRKEHPAPAEYSEPEYEPASEELDYLEDEDDGELAGEDAINEAERIRAEAEQMAQEIASQAEAEAMARREKTEDELQQLMESTLKDLETQREALERETRTRIEQEYRERYLQAITNLERCATELEARRDEYVQDLEQPALELVMAIARRLLGTELTRSPAFVAGLITSAFQMLKPEGTVHVELHPATFHLLGEDGLLTAALREAGINPERVELGINETLNPDAFSARVGSMSIDYDLDSLIDELINHLAERAATERGEGGGDGE